MRPGLSVLAVFLLAGLLTTASTLMLMPATPTLSIGLSAVAIAASWLILWRGLNVPSGPAFFTLLIVTTGCTLGAWQINRLHWKEALLAQLDNVQHSAPINLNDEYLRNFTIADYQPVKVTGHFDYAHEMLMPSRVHEGEVGYHVLTPLTTDIGQTYLINRGWIPDDRKDPASRSAGQISGDVTITGIARLPRTPSRWQPANDIAHNLWYGYDLSLMYAVNDIKTQPPQFFIEADAAPNPGGLPIGGVTQLDIPNNHLQYVITWYSLAAIIALIFAFSRLKATS